MSLPPVLVPLGLWPLLAWLAGGIPWGVLLVRWVSGADLRRIGSGNTGATNAARAMGSRRAGLLLFLGVYLLDLGKGILMLLLLPLVEDLDPGLSALAFVATGGGVILGHCFSPWLRFRGGKGVATTCGVLLALDWRLLLLGLGVFFALFLAFRLVSLGSMAMGACLPLLWLLLPGHPLGQEGDLAGLLFLAALAALIVERHRANLARLLRGTEPRVRLWGRGTKEAA